MAVQSPPTPAAEGPQAPSHVVGVIAGFLWVVAALLGVGGALVIVLMSELGELATAAILLAAVSFGLLLGAAVVVTQQARGRQPAMARVFIGAMLGAIIVQGAVGAFAWQRTERAASDACSDEEIAQFTTLSFAADLEKPPEGTQYGSCYVLHTVDGTGREARITMQQLLVGDGWRHTCEPHCGPDTEYHFHDMYRDGFILTVLPEGSHDLPGDALVTTRDGATTFALDIRPSPCSQADVDILQAIYTDMYVASGYEGEPGPGIDLAGHGPDEACQTSLGFSTDDQARAVLAEAMAQGGWNLADQDGDRDTYRRGDLTLEARFGWFEEIGVKGVVVTVVP